MAIRKAKPYRANRLSWFCPTRSRDARDRHGHIAREHPPRTTGHLLGASAALEAVITIKAMEQDFLPPTINYQVPDEACDLDIVPNKGYAHPINCAISNSLGFGGHNVTLVFQK